MKTVVNGTYLLYANLRHTLFRDMASGLRAWHHNKKGAYALRLVELGNHNDLRDALTDALGVAGTFYDDTSVSLVRDSGVPVVRMSNSRFGVDFSTVCTDDETTGRMAADFFIRRGFQSLIYVGNRGNPYSDEREAGFRAELRERLPDAGPPAVFDRSDTDAVAELAAESLVPVAVFCATDGVARSVLEGLLRSKVAVPGKAAVLGVDNDRLEQSLSLIPLASIRLPGYQIGYLTGQLLDRLLDTPGRAANGSSERVRVPPVEVVARRSADALAVGDARTRRLLQLIHTEGDGFRSVDDLVNAARLPRRTAEDCFRKHTGRTLFEELSEVRFDRINALLSDSDLTLSAISERCGFSDSHALCIAFKRRFGITPGSYRKQVRSLA